MGIADSKIVAQKLLIACEVAQTQGKDELDADSLWRDEVVTKAAKRVFQHVPRHVRGTVRQNAAERAAAKTCSKIVVPEVVKDIQANQKKALEQQGSQQETYNSLLQSGYLENQTENCTLAGYYMLMNKVEKNTNIGIIRLRLQYLLFYRLKQHIQPTGLWDDAISFMVEVIGISGLVEESKNDIREKLVAWVDKGTRYALLARDLGGLGSLFVLPDDIPESVWCKDLPKSKDNEKRIKLLNQMKKRGIVPIARNLNTTAQMELDNLWTPIKISVDMEAERQLSCNLDSSYPQESNQYHSPHEQGGTLGDQNVSLPHSRDTPSQSPRAADYAPPLQSVEGCDTHLAQPMVSSYNLSVATYDPIPFTIPENSSPSHVLNSVPNNMYHDLASFSMYQNTVNTGSFYPLEANNHHDLASFSLLADNHAAADIFPSVLGHHDLASFSVLPDPSIGDLSFPIHCPHDLASFSMVSHPAFANASATSDIQHGSETLTPERVSGDSVLASNMNHVVSVPTTVSERPSVSTLSSSSPGMVQYTPVLIPA